MICIIRIDNPSNEESNNCLVFNCHSQWINSTFEISAAITLKSKHFAWHQWLPDANEWSRCFWREHMRTSSNHWQTSAYKELSYKWFILLRRPWYLLIRMEIHQLVTKTNRCSSFFWFSTPWYRYQPLRWLITPIKFKIFRKVCLICIGVGRWVPEHWTFFRSTNKSEIPLPGDKRPSVTDATNFAPPPSHWWMWFCPTSPPPIKASVG